MHREDIYKGKRELWPKTGSPKFIDWPEGWQPAMEAKQENDYRGEKLTVVWDPKE